MLPLVFIIVFSIQIFRTARDNGYNAPLWTAIAAIGFFVVQLIVGFGIGVFLIAGTALWDWSPTVLEDNQFLLGLVGMAPAFVFVWLIWRYINVIRDDGQIAEPPPPPTF